MRIAPPALAGMMAAAAVAVALFLLFAPRPARGHDIYGGVGDDHGVVNCCDDRDCEGAAFRMRPDGAEFYSARLRRWVFVPTAKITFRALKGARTGAHWCGYQDAEGTGAVYTRCAFIEPGGA